jgi:hypothetical protein
MVSNILHVPIFHQDIGIIVRRRGIISGSYFTNIMDSLCNVMILHYCDVSTKSISRAIVYGDDNLVCGDKQYPSIRTIQQKLTIFSMTITTSESDWSNSFRTEFAGSVWDKEGPERSIPRMLMGACLQKSKWPRFPSKRELLRSRFFTVLQADRRVFSLMKQLRLPVSSGMQIYQFGITAQQAKGLKVLAPQVAGFINVPRVPWLRL